MKRSIVLGAAAALVLAAFSPAIAGEKVQLVLETRADAPAGQEVFYAPFASLGSFLSTGPGGEGGSYVGVNINEDYKIAGFDMYNGQPYLLLESRVDSPAGQEVFIAPFASLNSFLTTGPGGEGGAYVGVNINSDYEIAGFDIYNDQPYLLLETRVDLPAGQEVFIAPFASLNSFLSTGPGGEGGAYIGVNINEDYRIADFDIYNGQPYLLLESRLDSPAGQEVFIAPFASLNSFLTTGPGGEGGAYIGVNINEDYEIVGFNILPDAQTPGVPEPGIWALMMLGFGGAGAALRRKRHDRACA